MTSSTQQKAFVVSLALHAALGMWVEVRADERAPTAAAAAVPARDAWNGSGIEVDAPPAPATESVAPPSEAPPTEAPPSDIVPRAAANDAVPKRASRRTATGEATARPNRASVATEGATAAATGAATDTAPSSTGGAAPPAAFGAVGLPPGVRHLPRAFARAVALANRGDAAWRTLPAGVVGEASVALPVEENGALGSLVFDDTLERDRLLPAVRRLLDNTVLLLAAGRFSLDTRNLSGGIMRVRVRVEIVEQSARADPDVDPNELNAIDYEPPQAGKPGHGAFLLNSGRRVVCWVTPLG